MDKRKTAKHGFPQKKQKPKFMYKPKLNSVGASSSGTKGQPDLKVNSSNVKVHNTFGVLTDLNVNPNNVEIQNTLFTLTDEIEEGEIIKLEDDKSNAEDDGFIDPIQTEISTFMNAEIKKASWNVRGLNRPLKQREVQQIVSEHHLNVCAILESHVQVSNLSKVCCGVFKKWDWTSNGGICNRGTRIIVGWNNEMVDLMVLAQTEQVMHVQLVSKIDSKTLFCSFVYAKNTYQERRDLWKDLCKHKQMMEDKPWIVMGDFNSALYVDDYLYGTSIPSIGMREFFECVQYNELVDIQGHGLHFTWNQKPRKGVGILKKIDRVMGNMKFLDMVPEAYVLYHPYRVSDHTPCILRMKSLTRVKPKPFKFANFIASKDGFKPCVNEEWANRVEGIPMFSVVKKLRNLKTPLRKLMFEQGNLHDKVTKLRLKLDEIHKQIDRNPLDTNLRDTEAKVIKDFHSAAYDEESFLKQKAKIDWLCAGDANTTYFHNYVKHKNARSKIHSISDVRGNHFEGTDVETALVNHYATFLGKEDRVDELNMENLFVNVIHPEAALQMIRQVTREEVKEAMFSIGENKAPGPDGYTSAFFKKSWDIVGEEVTTAILQFFDNGKLLQQVNHTIIALVPKVPTPNSVLDYRPISCCNVIFKCISKILTNRIKGSLTNLVDINQSAFVPGRKISDNILLTQELMHNYHLNKGKPRCAFKIHIQKAYDTVSWSFLKDILVGFGFHQKMVGWIMTCVTTVSYSLSINGNLSGYFKGKRGLRQGDPMSPHLFTLIMEVLSLLLHQKADKNPAFRYHEQCKKQKIINVSFADDLFLFVNADPLSIKIFRDALNKFSQVSGLTPNLAKSTAYFSTVSQPVKQEILTLMPFKEGALPVRYLGVPLISSRLMYRDCKVLVDRLDKKIDNWMTKSLSFAGRLQLIKSVMSAMHIYWASVFMLPARIINYGSGIH
ncbi:hypothetical protein L1987_24173 [Smallanthus sonchifolius]|uniref:Uncharacterized protein n=1 Tax=Smallanthus sonchifolius TaxID=185202 RepID=A0ACB9IL60_9ASTR|nr:hypothetical protein L1987_24173 [Smallanthus sonchifolius]